MRAVEMKNIAFKKRKFRLNLFIECTMKNVPATLTQSPETDKKWVSIRL